MASDLANRYLPQFQEQARSRLATIEKLLGAGSCVDLTAVGFQLHALAGEASMLGFGDVVDVARAGERAASGAARQPAAACADAARQIANLLEDLTGSLPATRPPRRFSVLLVDDSPIIAETLADGLRDAGFDVEIADTSASIRDALESRRPDVIVTDLMMPDLDASAVAALAREAGPPQPRLLLMSGRTADELAPEIGRVGADDAVSKEDGIEAIVARVRGLVALRS